MSASFSVLFRCMHVRSKTFDMKHFVFLPGNPFCDKTFSNLVFAEAPACFFTLMKGNYITLLLNYCVVDWGGIEHAQLLYIVPQGGIKHE